LALSTRIVESFGIKDRSRSLFDVRNRNGSWFLWS
jgi:hypothetical protein